MTLDVLQDKIGYRFKDESLLLLAVTHSSWANEHAAGNAHNERLEFLGDAVLEIAVSAQLFRRFPEAREGELTRLRSSLVNEATLAVIARGLHLDACLRLALWCGARAVEKVGATAWTEDPEIIRKVPEL